MDSIVLILIDMDANGGFGGSDWGESGDGTKKCGAECGDPNLRFQPRLPGSVVGKASMRQVRKGGKITRVTVLW